MIRLLVFEVLLFGLFGVLLGQFMGQSREAYAIWIKEIVYPVKDENSAEKKRELCSTMESISREICGLCDMIWIIVLLIDITYLVTILTVIFSISEITS